MRKPYPLLYTYYYVFLSIANYQTCVYRGLKSFIAMPIPNEMIDFCTAEH
jgi:hypothetical protein